MYIADSWAVCVAGDTCVLCSVWFLDGHSVHCCWMCANYTLAMSAIRACTRLSAVILTPHYMEVYLNPGMVYLI